MQYRNILDLFQDHSLLKKKSHLNSAYHLFHFDLLLGTTIKYMIWKKCSNFLDLIPLSAKLQDYMIRIMRNFNTNWKKKFLLDALCSEAGDWDQNSTHVNGSCHLLKNYNDWMIYKSLLVSKAKKVLWSNPLECMYSP